MTIDLHIHTTASDGDMTPQQLLNLALKRRLRVIAVTDHDNTHGSREVQRLAHDQLTVIPAIELGAEDHGLIDILGYFIRPAALADQTPFQHWLSELRQDRQQRARRMVQRLAEIGIPISFERVQELANGAPITRPHIARALVEAGHAESIKDAFNRYIDEHAPAYVPRKRLAPEDAIAKLHQVGACAVLAHPARVKNYPALIERLVLHGLDGVEVVHPDNSADVRLNLRGLAKQYNLVMTGGSDFHRPDRDGKITLGLFNPPDGAVEALRARAQRYNV
ncbi:MAG: PHP domain-containing protein [Chloroflexi bacterium]|nr:PHP domain-containing protein [Chloroflexota bacterium]